MEYKKKVVVLSCIIASLALTYVGAVAFDPARRGARADVHAWLDPRDIDRIGRIVIALPHSDPADAVVLTRNERRWFVSRDGVNYPARNMLVDDFVAELARRAPYPVRATSAAAHARLSLTYSEAARVTVAGIVGPPFLDLLIGQNDPAGRDVYMRRAGGNEVRSGEDRFSARVRAAADSWYDLMLFPESADGMIGVADVMRLTVYPPANGDAATAPMVFTRVARAWEVNFDIEALNQMRVDAFVRDVLMSAGEGFAGVRESAAATFGDSRLVLEFGDGGSTAISFTEPDHDGRRLAAVSGANPIYAVSGWMHRRLFPAAETFGL